MTTRPILFSGPMVRAILDGRKTQTRRAVKSRSKKYPFYTMLDYGNGWRPYQSPDGDSPWCDGNEYQISCPYGAPGDRLLVRETWRQCIRSLPTTHPQQIVEGHEGVLYRAYDEFRVCRAPDGYDKGYGGRWKPSIHMPRWASRITLEITDVRVERLQEITPRDAVAEGSDMCCARPCDDYEELECPGLIGPFKTLWDSINAKKHPWESNPWVWCVSFKVLAT